MAINAFHAQSLEVHLFYLEKVTEYSFLLLFFNKKVNIFASLYLTFRFLPMHAHAEDY